MAKPKPLSDQIRRAVRDSGLTQYRVAAETGISHSVMSRFMTGKGGLSMESMDRIGKLLDLEIHSRKD